LLYSVLAELAEIFFVDGMITQIIGITMNGDIQTG